MVGRALTRFTAVGSPCFCCEIGSVYTFEITNVTGITVYLALDPIASVPCSLNAYLQSEALAVRFSPART